MGKQKNRGKHRKTEEIWENIEKQGKQENWGKRRETGENKGKRRKTEKHEESHKI